MNKEVISDWQAISLVVLFILGESLGMQTAPAAGKDLWLAVLLAIVITLPVSLVYARLLSLFYGKDLFDILEYIFGKFFGKVMSLLFTWYAFHTGFWVLRNNVEYPVTVTFPETPKVVFAISIIFLAIWIVKEGIKVFGRWSTVFFTVVAILLVSIFLMLIPQLNIGDIQPMIDSGIRPLIKGTFQAVTFPFGEIVIFLMILSSLKNKTSYYKVYTSALLISGIAIVILSLVSILIIGTDLYLASYFPLHSVVGTIKIGGFIERLEIIAIILTFTTIFVKVSVYLLAACRGVAKIFNFKDYRFLVVPIGLLMCNFAFFGEDSIISHFELLDTVWLYYSFPFQVILPIIILIAAETKKKRLANN